MSSGVVIWKVDANKRQKNSIFENELPKEHANWTIYDYYRVAKRCIAYFANGGLARTMLRNEDAISFVAEHLVYASYRWEEGRGRTLNSYLNQCALWSIQRWLKMSKRQRTHISLSEENYKQGSMSREATIDSLVDSPEQAILDSENRAKITRLIDNAGLTDKQRNCIRLIYQEGEKPSDVARSLGISRQAVQQHTKHGVEKIKLTMSSLPLDEQIFT